MDEATYKTEEGITTWYQVKVLENGCDSLGKMGCGNDFNGAKGQAATEGWMNARYIELK
jgi:hypothetical protein